MTRRIAIARRFFAPVLMMLVTFLAARPAVADWRLESTQTLTAPAEGIAHHAQTVLGSVTPGATATRATLHFVSFPARAYTFRIFDQGTLGRARLAEVMQSNRCIAGTNGGFFQPDFDPVGLLLADGHLVHGQGYARILSGALVVRRKNHIRLLRSTEPLPGKNALEAVQAGPFLVDGGKAVAGLNNVRSARRTAVLTGPTGEWSLVSSSAVTLEELGAILADSGLLPAGLHAERALNLDGGSSTALWVRQPGAEPYSAPEFGIVRDFIGIVPRP